MIRIAKSKKSKILASVLAVSTMAVFYAAPVLAGDATVTSDPGRLLISIDNNGDISSNGIYFDRRNNAVFGYVSIAGSNIAEALTGQSLDRINTISANSVTVGGETINASVIQNWNNMARANENVGGIERESGVDFAGRPLDTTTIEGKTTIDSLGRLNTDTVIATTGQFGDVIVTGNSLTNVGFINGAEVSGSNGALTISGVELNNGLVDGVDVSELSSAATDISGLVKKTAGIDKVGAITTIEGVAFAQGHMDADAVVTDKLTVADELTVNGLSNLDGVRVDNGSIYAENDSYVGGVQLADGLVDGVNM